MRLLIYGSSDFGRVLRRQLAACGHEFEGFIDDVVGGPDVLGGYENVRDRFPPAAGRGIVMAVGYNHLEARWTLYGRVRGDGYALPALLHPAAHVHPEATVGEGAIVGAGANVDAGARVGPLAVLWPGAIVSHDSEIGDNTFLSPGAIVCGLARVGAHSFIGAGAVVPDHADLAPATFLAAGRVAARRPAPPA
ncbi:MAG TPA: hypothetical protein VN213_20840 [Solirubrobacteraceae bacterium]|nr:hypothetical protein [Solirubrobacteraceae bacterium]